MNITMINDKTNTESRSAEAHNWREGFLETGVSDWSIIKHAEQHKKQCLQQQEKETQYHRVLSNDPSKLEQSWYSLSVSEAHDWREGFLETGISDWSLMKRAAQRRYSLSPEEKETRELILSNDPSKLEKSWYSLSVPQSHEWREGFLKTGISDWSLMKRAAHKRHTIR
jgi:hypothetical protein